MPLDQTHQHSSADVMKADDPHTPISPDGGSVPTLAEVLAAGNDPGTATDPVMQSASVGSAAGGIIFLNPGEDTVRGGTPSLQGGTYGAFLGGEVIAYGATPTTSGPVTIYAGQSDTGEYGGEIDFEPASTGTYGRVAISSLGQYGTIGQAFVGDGDGYGIWASLLSTGSGAPGSSFTTLFYLDTTSSTGGLYAWDGGGYTKVSLALT